MAWVIREGVGCPYKDECGTKVRNRFYCNTAKHLKCIEFQILRDKEVKSRKRS